MAEKEYTDIAIGDIGTQFYWFNPKNSGSSGSYKGAFEYGVPVTAGAEFGGDTESFEAPETDLDYVPKVAGRATLNDIAYTSNYTAEKYSRIVDITSNGKNTYMEVFTDGSATIFQGTAGRPTITTGDVRQINFSIVASFMLWIKDIKDISADEKSSLDALGLTEIYKQITSTSKYYINVDKTTVPTARQKYFEGYSAS